MKILLIGNYPPPFGGISVHVQLLNRSLLREGIDCQVLNVDPRVAANPEYIHSNGYADFIYRLIDASRGRVAHLHTNGHNPKSWLLALTCGWLGRLLGTGSMLTIHSGMSPEYICQSRGKERLIIKTALSVQDIVICVNEKISAAIAQFDFPLSRTLLLPAFLFDDRELIALDEELMGRLSNFQPLLSTIGFFRPEYGIELLIEALSLLAQQFPHIGCAILGSGDGQLQLQELAARHGVAERLLWLGDLDHGRCLSIIKTSQLFVRPTLADGDAVSVREAIHLGVPVVASDVGARPSAAALFRAGDVAEFVEKCHATIINSRFIATMPAASSVGIMPLLDAYRRICDTSSFSLLDTPI
jgi:glycosyltransferase involved in cell wall biosynthesis